MYNGVGWVRNGFLLFSSIVILTDRLKYSVLHNWTKIRNVTNKKAGNNAKCTYDIRENEKSIHGFGR